jgi:hypothetical protein
MGIEMRMAGLLFAGIFLLGPKADASGWNLGKKSEARKFASTSKAPLSKGEGDCLHLSANFPTLGAAVAWHSRRANVENQIDCQKTDRAWSCSASFVYNNKKESEREWALFLKFSVDEKTMEVHELRCDVAG